MTQPTRAIAILLFATFVAAVFVSGTMPMLAQQSPAARAIPRTADGKPDLSGVWIAGTQPLLVGEQEAARLRALDAAAKRPPFQREPPPYKPEYEKKRLEYVARRGIDDPMARCLLSGVPRVTTRPLPFQIVQTKDLVVILYEAHHAFRIIPTDGRPHPDDLEPSYLGDSIGRWDGDTLVVDVVGFNEETWLAWPGYFHTNKMRVIERLRREGNVLHYQVTVEDPDVLAQPWVMDERIMRLNTQPMVQIEDPPCVESDGANLYTKERG